MGLISPVGDYQGNAGIGLATLAITGMVKGDLLALHLVSDSGFAVSTITTTAGETGAFSKGFASTILVGEIWAAVVTAGTPQAPASTTLTITYTGATTTSYNQINGLLVTCGLGNNSRWSFGGGGQLDNTVSSVTMNFPTLTPSAPHSMYFAFGAGNGTATASPTPGFVSRNNPNSADQIIWNTDVSSTVAPTSSFAAATTSKTVAMLFSAGSLRNVPVAPMSYSGFY